jgi:hypothetical protein
VEAHAGSKYDGTGMTCDDGDTNSLAVFLLGMGKHSYYACSYVFYSGNTAAEGFAGRDAW